MSKNGTGLVRLADVPLRPARVRASLRGVTSWRAPWSELTTAEPGLQVFMDELRAVRGVDDNTCTMAYWYGVAKPESSMRHRLERFIGDQDTPAFASAHRALYDLIRPCRHCFEQELAEVHIEGDVAMVLAAGGESVRRQVRTVAGIADIVTDGAVYEVKLWLTRHALLTAIGQVSLYWVALGDEARRRVIVGQMTPETAALAPAIDQLGIDVEAW